MAEGMAGINARMNQIQQQISLLTPRPATTTTTTTTQTGAAAKQGSFESALAQATSTASATVATGPPASLKVNSAGVPVDLAKFGNGKIPANALTPLGDGNHKLWQPAAQQFNSMKAAAQRDGVKIGVTDSYRSYEEQVAVAKKKGLYSQGGLAAKPGTSEHGWGLSLDLDLNTKAQAWMRKHGAEYGWKENVPREPWHWTFKP